MSPDTPGQLSVLRLGATRHRRDGFLFCFCFPPGQLHFITFTVFSTGKSKFSTWYSTTCGKLHKNLLKKAERLWKKKHNPVGAIHESPVKQITYFHTVRNGRIVMRPYGIAYLPVIQSNKHRHNPPSADGVSPVITERYPKITAKRHCGINQR